MDNQKRVESLKRRYGRNVAPAKRRGPMGGPGHGRQHGKGGMPKNSRETIRRLLSYLNGYKLHMGLAFFCVIVNTVATLTGSYMLRPIINKYIAPMDGSRGSVGGLAASLVFMAAIYFVGVVANYAQSRVMLTVAQNALQKIRDELFTKMQKLPVRFYDTNNNGDLMSRFTNDVDTVGQMLSSTLVQLADPGNRLYDSADDEGRRLCGRKEPEVFLRTADLPRRRQRLYRGDDQRPEGREGLLS